MTKFEADEIDRKQVEMLKEMIALKTQERAALREKLCTELRLIRAAKRNAEAETVKEIGHD